MVEHCYTDSIFIVNLKKTGSSEGRPIAKTQCGVPGFEPLSVLFCHKTNRTHAA